MKKNEAVTKKQFVETYNKYKPSGWIKFGFKYFSKETEAKDMKLSQTITWILSFLFLGGFISTVLNLPEIITKISALAFTGILIILAGYLGSVFIANNRRIKKIAKELDISINSYNYLANLWGDELK